MGDTVSYIPKIKIDFLIFIHHKLVLLIKRVNFLFEREIKNLFKITKKYVLESYTETRSTKYASEACLSK